MPCYNHVAKENEGKKERIGPLTLNLMKKVINIGVVCLIALALRVNPNHIRPTHAFVVTGSQPLALLSYRTIGKGEGKGLKKFPRLINQSLNATVRKVLLD